MARPSAEKLALLQKLLAERGAAKGTTPPLQRRTGGGDAPLSFGQRRLWFLDRFQPNTSLYNDALALTIRGIELDVEAFREAWSEVVRRHDALRTTFVLREGEAEPVQHVEEGAEIALDVVDLRAADEPRAALDARLLEEVRGPFALDRLPLVRATLARVADREWVFGLTMHHIVSDGVSYGIVYAELAALYRASTAGAESPLEELPIQFADYAAWERAAIPEERIASLLPFWKRYLGGELPALAWPAKQVEPRNRGAYHRFRFPDALYAALQDFCRREQVTSNWALMAAYFVLLHLLGGQEDVRVGTPSSHRKRNELEGLVGFFVQTVLLRVDLSGNPSFREVLERTRRTALEVADHEDVPFDRVVQAVRPKRDASLAPLIQAWIAPMKDLMPLPDLPGAECSYEIVDGKNARFELCLILDEARGGVSAFFEYDVDLFDAPVVARFAERYMRILRQGVDHPETTLKLFRETMEREPGSAKQRGKLREMKRVRRRAVSEGGGG